MIARHSFVLVTCLSLSALGGCKASMSVNGEGVGSGSGTGQPGGGDAYGGAPGSVEVITDDNGTQYQIQVGEKGAPGVIGCADGQREAFVDRAQFPRIAGCLATWEGQKSLRAAGTGLACGDDGSPCAVPADVCAPGWHVCGNTGALADLMQVTPDQCARAGGGRYSAAISHCLTQSGCQYDARAEAKYPCFESGWCSEPVCCGNDCGDFGACTGGVWPEATHIAQGTDQGCAAQTSQRAGGVLCCAN